MTGVQFPYKQDNWACDVCHKPLNQERPDWGYHGWGKVHSACEKRIPELFDIQARECGGSVTFHYIPKGEAR